MPRFQGYVQVTIFGDTRGIVPDRVEGGRSMPEQIVFRDASGRVLTERDLKGAGGPGGGGGGGRGGGGRPVAGEDRGGWSRRAGGAPPAREGAGRGRQRRLLPRP